MRESSAERNGRTGLGGQTRGGEAASSLRGQAQTGIASQPGPAFGAPMGRAFVLGWTGRSHHLWNGPPLLPAS
jgi:hypothetical protein